jgi:hypothetical protein
MSIPHWTYLVTAFYFWMGGTAAVLCYEHLKLRDRFLCTCLGCIWPLVFAYSCWRARGEAKERSA